MVNRRRVVIAAAWLLLAGGVVRAETQIVTEIPGVFIDISQTGLALNLLDDEERILDVATGNLMLAAGAWTIANNGGIGFPGAPDSNLSPVNQPIPSNDAFGGGQSVLPLWDDIDDKDGDVYFLETNDRAIIQWNMRPIGSAPGSHVTFQVQVFNNVDSGVFAQFLYLAVTDSGGGISATIGYQDGGAGFNDVLFSFNSATVGDGSVLSLIIPDQVPARSNAGRTILLLVMAGVGVWAMVRIKTS